MMLVLLCFSPSVLPFYPAQRFEKYVFRFESHAKVHTHMTNTRITDPEILELYILQRGVQWKQGVVVYILS